MSPGKRRRARKRKPHRWTLVPASSYIESIETDGRKMPVYVVEIKDYPRKPGVEAINIELYELDRMVSVLGQGSSGGSDGAPPRDWAHAKETLIGSVTLMPKLEQVQKLEPGGKPRPPRKGRQRGKRRRRFAELYRAMPGVDYADDAGELDHGRWFNLDLRADGKPVCKIRRALFPKKALADRTDRWGYAELGVKVEGTKWDNNSASVVGKHSVAGQAPWAKLWKLRFMVDARFPTDRPSSLTMGSESAHNDLVLCLQRHRKGRVSQIHALWTYRGAPFYISPSTPIVGASKSKLGFRSAITCSLDGSTVTITKLGTPSLDGAEEVQFTPHSDFEFAMVPRNGARIPSHKDSDDLSSVKLDIEQLHWTSVDLREWKPGQLVDLRSCDYDEYLYKLRKLTTAHKQAEANFQKRVAGPAASANRTFDYIEAKLMDWTVRRRKSLELDGKRRATAARDFEDWLCREVLLSHVDEVRPRLAKKLEQVWRVRLKHYPRHIIKLLSDDEFWKARYDRIKLGISGVQGTVEADNWDTENAAMCLLHRGPKARSWLRTAGDMVARAYLSHKARAAGGGAAASEDGASKTPAWHQAYNDVAGNFYVGLAKDLTSRCAFDQGNLEALATKVESELPSYKALGEAKARGLTGAALKDKLDLLRQELTLGEDSNWIFRKGSADKIHAKLSAYAHAEAVYQSKVARGLHATPPDPPNIDWDATANGRVPARLVQGMGVGMSGVALVMAMQSWSEDKRNWSIKTADATAKSLAAMEAAAGAIGGCSRFLAWSKQMDDLARFGVAPTRVQKWFRGSIKGVATFTGPIVAVLDVAVSAHALMSASDDYLAGNKGALKGALVSLGGGVVALYAVVLGATGPVGWTLFAMGLLCSYLGGIVASKKKFDSAALKDIDDAYSHVRKLGKSCDSPGVKHLLIQAAAEYRRRLKKKPVDVAFTVAGKSKTSIHIEIGKHIKGTLSIRQISGGKGRTHIEAFYKTWGYSHPEGGNDTLKEYLDDYYLNSEAKGAAGAIAGYWKPAIGASNLMQARKVLIGR